MAAAALRLVLRWALGALVAVALLVSGLLVVPAFGMAIPEPIDAPRRPPRLPPVVPLWAPEEWALWSYLTYVTPIWGQDWPTVIQSLEELRARFPANPLVIEKLYAAYIEAGKTLEGGGDTSEARRRYQQAAELDPGRGEAYLELERLDASGQR